MISGLKLTVISICAVVLIVLGIAGAGCTSANQSGVPVQAPAPASTPAPSPVFQNTPAMPQTNQTVSSQSQAPLPEHQVSLTEDKPTVDDLKQIYATLGIGVPVAISGPPLITPDTPFQEAKDTANREIMLRIAVLNAVMLPGSYTIQLKYSPNVVNMAASDLDFTLITYARNFTVMKTSNSQDEQERAQYVTFLRQAELVTQQIGLASQSEALGQYASAATSADTAVTLMQQMDLNSYPTPPKSLYNTLMLQLKGYAVRMRDDAATKQRRSG